MATATLHLPAHFQRELRTVGLDGLLPRKPWDPARWDSPGKVDKLRRESNAKSWTLIFKIATSSLTGWLYSPNKPSTMKVTLKRKKEKKAIPRRGFFKRLTCILIMGDFSVCVFYWWLRWFAEVLKSLGGKQQNMSENLLGWFSYGDVYISDKIFLTRYVLLLIYLFLKIEPLHSIYFSF